MSQLERLHDAEAAGIARWFRDGEHGLVYFDLEGRALPIADRERERWQAQAMKQLDRYIADYDRAPREILLIGVVLAASAYAATALFGDLLKPIRGMEALFAAPACFWPMAAAARFRRDQKRLRRDIAEQLMMRTPLPDSVAARRRRFNIFATGQVIAALATLTIAGIGTYRNDPSFGLPAIVALVAVGYLLHWAAKRVDATHRRKLW